jgi:hypothetical protein
VQQRRSLGRGAPGRQRHGYAEPFACGAQRDGGHGAGSRARLEGAAQRLLRGKGAYTVSLRNGESYEVLGFDATYDLAGDAVAGDLTLAGDFGERDVFAGAVVLTGDDLCL